MKKFYHLLVTSYKLHVTSYKLQVERFKRFTSHLLPLTSYLLPLTAYLFLFLPFFAFAQAPDPGCNCIQFDNLCWATCSVAEPYTFAASPTEIGWFYQWGINVGWSPTNPMTDSNGGTTWNTTASSLTAWTTDLPCPAGWRLPTRLEFVNLATYMVPTPVFYKLSYLRVAFFDSGDPSQPLLVLAAHGGRQNNDGRLWGADNGFLNGYYWSSTQSSPVYAYLLSVGFGTVNPSSTQIKATGFEVRCVADL